MGMFSRGKRLVMVISNQTGRNESSRMEYLRAEADKLDLGGIIQFAHGGTGLLVILEGENQALNQFLSFAQASFGQTEKIDYHFEADKNEFEYVQIKYAVA